MSLTSFFSSTGVYSPDKERAYYSKAKEDRRAVPYDFDKYFRGSIGLDFFRNKKVLDIGCGEGTFSAWIADRGGAEKVTGLELIEHRIRRDFEKKLPNLEFRQGNIFETQIQEKFDVVFFNLVLHHLRFDMQKALGVVRGALKPGGQFASFEPNPYSPIGMLGFLCHEGSLSANEGFLSSGRLRRELAQAGFSDIRHGYFWRDRKWAQHALIGSSFWVTARSN